MINYPKIRIMVFKSPGGWLGVDKTDYSISISCSHYICFLKSFFVSAYSACFVSIKIRSFTAVALTFIPY